MKLSLRKKLCSVAVSAVMATSTICAVAPSAHAETAKPQYLASIDAPTISATNDQLNLPFDPNLYYVYSLLTPAGKQTWDWTIRELLAFNPANTYSGNVTLTKDSSGNGLLTFDLKKKGINATYNDVKNLKNYFVWNEPRLFILNGWGSSDSNKDGNVDTLWFKINRNWMTPDKYQDKLVEMESTVDGILAQVDTRQDDAQRLNALYDRYMAKVTYGSYSSAVTGAEATMVDAFVNGKVVCSGYSKGFEYLAMRAGVAAAYMLGYAGGYHAWNAVQLDNKWYYVDSTWDDIYANRGGGNRVWFLKGLSSMSRTLQSGIYSTPPKIEQANYQTTSWLAPEDVVPRADKAIDQIVATVKATFNEQPSLISQVNKITVSLPSGKTSGTGIFDAIYQNNLNQNLKKLNLAGSATITVTGGGLNSANDVITKGLTVDYKLPGATDTYGWAKGKFINKTTGETISDEQVAKKVLDMGTQVATRALNTHAAEISDISSLMVNLPETTVAYQGTTDAEKETTTQIKANLQGKFDGELSVMVMGNYTSVKDLLAKGLVVGYKATDGTYYTMANNKVSVYK